MGQRRIACSVAILLLTLGSAVQQRCCWAQAIAPAAATARTDLYGDPLPTGAISRLGTTRFRHGSQWLKGLALTPDGKTLIAAAEEHSLHFWDTATGRQIKQLRTDPLSIRGFAMSPDGRQIAVAGFWYPEDNSGAKRQVRVLDTASGGQIRTFSRTDPDVDGHTMAFTPDGKMLVSLGTSGDARIEELASGVEILQYRFPRDNSPSLALSPLGGVGIGHLLRKLALIPHSGFSSLSPFSFLCTYAVV
jgi:WD40 repeat protein